MSGNIRGSGTRSVIAAHSAAVDHYLRTGDSSRVREFKGMVIKVDGTPTELLTDLRQLRRLAAAGQVSFEDLYVYHG